MIGFDTEVSSDQPLVLLAAFVIGTLAVTRITRLIVDDDYPPVRWATQKFQLHVPEKWAVLVECPWCVAPYVTLVDLIWAWASGLHWTWWFGNVWAATSWIASFLCLRDVPEDQRE